MNEFLNSKLVEDLKNGKLPPVEVTVSTETLIQVGLVLFVAVAASLLVGRIIRII